jgi:hypothetical protein
MFSTDTIVFSKYLQSWFVEAKELKNREGQLYFESESCEMLLLETVKWQRPIGEGDQELEKRLVQEELIYNATHV